MMTELGVTEPTASRGLPGKRGKESGGQTAGGGRAERGRPWQRSMNPGCAEDSSGDSRGRGLGHSSQYGQDSEERTSRSYREGRLGRGALGGIRPSVQCKSGLERVMGRNRPCSAQLSSVFCPHKAV